MQVMGSITLRHHVFGFAGPLAALPLHHVFNYPLEMWLYSWPEEKWYATPCNGATFAVKNVFVRIPLIITTHEVKGKALAEGGQEIEEYGGALPTDILRYTDGDGENPDAEERELILPGDATYIDQEKVYFDADDGKLIERLNVRPNEHSLVIDSPSMGKPKYDYSTGVEVAMEWTHYFLVHLLPASLPKIFSIFKSNSESFAWLPGENLIEEMDGYNPRFGHWMWDVTGWGRGSREEVNIEYSLVYGGKPLPLALALLESNMLPEWDSYMDFVKEKDRAAVSLCEEESPFAAKSSQKYPLIGRELETWYALHVGLRRIDDIKAKMCDVVEAIGRNQLEYVEMLLQKR